MLFLLESIFSGDYLFERLVSALSVPINGIARFEKIHTNERHYEEQGYYYLKEKQQRCYQQRQFIWDNQHLYIHKSDGAVLHEFLLNEILTFPVQLTHRHECKADQYNLQMTLHSPEHFSTFYTINGPAKKYSIETLYSRS